MPKISVYIAAYNYATYIAESIDSVIKQTYSDWELIIINDGSTDNTKEVIEQYDHPNIRVVHQENKGLNVTNNIALRLARGEYIMRLDADDFLDENALLILSSTLDKKKDIDLVYPDYYLVDIAGKVLDLVRRKKIDDEVQLLDLPAHGACTIFRTSVLRQLGGYIEDYSCQDGYELWLRFIQRFKPYNLNIPLFYYRQHSESLTTNESRILETRRQIKRDFVSKNAHINTPKVLAVIPASRNSVYPKNDPLIELAGKPLIWYSIEEAQKSKLIDKIVVTSDDEEVLSYISGNEKIIGVKRSNDPQKNNIKLEGVLLETLDSIKEEHSYIPDFVCSLFVNTPLRRAKHIDWAIDTLSIFNLDSVISVEEIPMICYQHRENGLLPIAGSVRGVRLERDAIYKENGAVMIFNVSSLEEENFLGKSVGHIQMMPEESIKINSDYEFWLAEKIIMDYISK